MPCKNPFRVGVMEYGCGQCLYCRIVRKKIWITRALLESKVHLINSFVTLTYDDGHIPKGGTLDRKDLRKYIDRLRINARRKLNIQKIRYLAVGEYGEEKERPHYHLLLFGIGCMKGNIGYKCDCDMCKVIRGSWKEKKKEIGLVYVGNADKSAIEYTLGYILKEVMVGEKNIKKIMGLTNPEDEYVKKWLNGRYPEFVRYSTKPGLGGNSLDNILDAMCTKDGSRFIAEEGNMPDFIMHDGKAMPLGSYLKARLKKSYGFKPTISESGTESYTSDEELRRMQREKVEKDAEIYQKVPEGKDKYLYKKSLQERQNLSMKINSKKRSTKL